MPMNAVRLIFTVHEELTKGGLNTTVILLRSGLPYLKQRRATKSGRVG